MREDRYLDKERIRYLIESARAEQQEAICSRDSLVVVSAGAGTGKTHTLALRFAWLLATDPDCTVDQILTLTFSEAASREMRDRIRDTLEDWYRQEPRLLAHLGDAVRHIDEAYISTIHSFALRVIRESGLGLDLDPGAGLVPAPFENLFWEEYARIVDTLSLPRMASLLDEVWRARAGELFESDCFVEAVNYYGPDRLAELARKAGELFGSKGWTPESLWQWGDARDREVHDRVADQISAVWDQVWDLWTGTVIPCIAAALEGDKGVTSEPLRVFLAEFQDIPDTLEARRRFFSGVVNRGLSRIPGGKALKTVLEEALGKKAKDWRDERKKLARLTDSLFCEPLLTEAELKGRSFLLRMASLGWQAWENARRTRNLLSFSDLIRYAGDVLKAREDRMGFKHLMVDEFQDTDALQDMLLRSLWLPGRNTLFIVGDLKQSIYRFRHADLRLFAKYIEQALSDREKRHIPLNRSYRMNAPLIGAGNAFFSDIWSGGICGCEGIAYDPLLPPDDAPFWERRNDGCEDAGVEIMLSVAAETEAPVSADERRRILYDALASRFSALRNKAFSVWDKREIGESGERGSFRPVRWGDFCILVPSRSSYTALEEAFQAYGIPVVFTGSQAYYARGEVLDLINILRVLENPKEELALAGWISSPFSGLPPHTAVLLLCESQETGTPLPDLFVRQYPDQQQRLETLRRVALLDSPSAALTSLFETPSWLLSFPESARRRAYANVRHGVALVREYERSMGKSLPGCADYLDAELKRRAVQEEPELYDADADVVRVMTVHASKGLEFPVVAVVGLEQRIQRSRPSRTDVSLFCGVTLSSIPEEFGQEDGALRTPLWHGFLDEQEEEEEKQRLLYVAVTRAQERLILCGLAGKNETDSLEKQPQTLLDWILHANARLDHPIPVLRVESVSDGPPNTATTMQRSEPLSIKRLELSEHAAPSLARLSASAYALLRWCPRAYRLRYRQGRQLIWELPDGDGYGGVGLGNLAHYILERWDFTAEALEEWLPLEENSGLFQGRARALPSFLRAEYGNGRSRALLKEWFTLFAASEEAALLREQLCAGRLKRETPFRVHAGRVTLAGSMDLCWFSEGMHIRDWKITAENRAPGELYERQLLFYGGACHLMAPGQVRDVGMIYLRAGGESGGGVSLLEMGKTSDWDSVIEDIQAAAQDAVGDLDADLSRCGRCPWVRSCRPFT